jgi:hypothetical protein
MLDLNGSDPLIWTPSAIGGELNRVLGVFDTVNSEMSAAYSAGKVSGTEWNQWRAIYLSAHSFLTTASTLWGSNVASARLQEQEAGKWRNLIVSRGQATQGPADLVRKDPAAGGVSYWSLALYGSGAVAAYLGYLYLRKRVLGPKGTLSGTKAIVDSKQYYIVGPSGQRERGQFTRSEAITQAKHKEQELEELGYPKTKHRVVYGPTGENVNFDGDKRRRLRHGR